MTKAGAVTAGVTTASNGEKNNATKNSTAVTTAENPERAPAATPEVDSTYAVVVGLQGAGIIVDSPATLVTLGSFTGATLLAVFGIILSVILIIKLRSIGIFLGKTHGPYPRHYTTTYLIYIRNISFRFLDFNPISEHFSKKKYESSCKILI